MQITSIGTDAFSNEENKWTKIEKVQIPNSITKIGWGAFCNNNISELNLPKSLLEIDNYAFSSNKITKLIIPDSIKKIGDYAFAKNSISTLKLSNSLTEIQSGVFSENKISNLIIPKSVKKIMDDAFSFNSITDLEIPNTVEELGKAAFYYNWVNSLKISNNIKIIPIDCFSIEPNNSFFDFSFLTNTNIEQIESKGFKYYGSTIIKKFVLPPKLKIIAKGSFADFDLSKAEINFNGVDWKQLQFLDERNQPLPDDKTPKTEDDFIKFITQ